MAANLVGSIVKKVKDLIIEEGSMILGVQEDLKELQRTMNQVQCFLHDADQRRTEELAVNNWLGELREAMYKADDIIDMARLEGNMLLLDDSSSSRSSVRRGIFPFLSCLPNIRRRHEIAVQIRNLNTELEKISKLGERFLKLQSMQPKEEVSLVTRMKTCELVEPNLVGKETLQACQKLVDLILRHKDRKEYKVGIVGTGGIGKTTVAQKIYNDHRIKGAFRKQAWICVSQEYSSDSLLKEVLRNIGVHYGEDQTIGELSKRLTAALENETVFLVLDDIWQHEVWTNLFRTPLESAATTVILVTTRNDTAAQVVGVDYVHRVQLMSDNVGWDLLRKIINFNEDTEMQNLQGLGMKIVRMCGGLPLAIKVIASVLAAKERTENEWRKFINKSAWSMSRVPAELRGALYLSYDDLPSFLKPCFLYCALCPEDHYMYRHDLIRFWIAEGFVEEQEGQSLEDTAEEYYIELIYRNLLEPDPIFPDYSLCKIHDLLRQLAQHLSQDECFCGVPQSLEAKYLSKLRRISIVPDKCFIRLPDMGKEQIRARTFLIHCTKPTTVDNTIFKRLPYVRVLELSFSVLKSIPDCIGRLIHMRSLDLDWSDISYLPESKYLVNLQVLNLQHCGALHSLPLAITRLCNLRRLGLRGTPINRVPKGIGALKFLNDLEGFPVLGGKGNSTQMQDGWALEELDGLPQLRRLSMIKLEKTVPQITDSMLINKRHLKQIDLVCTKHTDEPYSEEEVSNIEETFELLIPPHNLEDLSILHFFGKRYPTWLCTTHILSLKYLVLKYFESCVHLPPIGQLPNLKYLQICGATAVTKIGTEFVGCGVGNPVSAGAIAFPKLEWLIISDMPNWEEWTFAVLEGEEEATRSQEVGEDGATVKEKREVPTPRTHFLPCLKDLELFDCPRLRALPQQLGQEATILRNLRLEHLASLKMVENFPFLSDHLFISSCESLERVSHLPRVELLNAQHCLKLRCVEKLDNLQQLSLTDDMEDISSLWLPGLQEQHKRLHMEDLPVNTTAR